MKLRLVLITGIALTAFCTFISSCGNNEETATAQSKTVPATVESKPAADIEWYNDWDAGMEAAKKAHKPAFVHFTADWCKYCIKMKEETYAADEIKKRFKEGWVTIMIDTEDREKQGTVYINETERKVLTYLNNEQENFQTQTFSNAQLLQFFGGRGLPTLLFIDKEGTPVQRISSFIPKEEFGVILDFFRDEAYKTTTFDEYKKNAAKKG